MNKETKTTNVEEVKQNDKTTSVKENKNSESNQFWKNKFIVGPALLVAGALGIILGAIAAFWYAVPLLTGGGSLSNNMTNAFSDLTLFHTGKANIVFALVGGVLSAVVGLIAMVWGTLIMTVGKLSLKSTVTFITSSAIVVLSFGMVIPAAIAVQKGTSDEVKMVSDFNDVNNFFNDAYEDIAKDMAGIIYISAKKGTNEFLQKVLKKDMEVTFSPAVAKKEGVIRNGLTYNVNTKDTSNKSKHTGLKGIYKNPDAMFLVPKTNDLKLINSVFMAMVDGLWTGLAVLGKQTVHHMVPSDTKNHGDSGIVKAPGINTINKPTDDETKQAALDITVNSVFDKMSDLLSNEPLVGKTKSQVKEILRNVNKTTGVAEGEQEWKLSLDTLKKGNDLIFKTLLGQLKVQKVSLDDTLKAFKQENLKAQLMVGLQGANAQDDSLIAGAQVLIDSLKENPKLMNPLLYLAGKGADGIGKFVQDDQNLLFYLSDVFSDAGKNFTTDNTKPENTKLLMVTIANYILANKPELMKNLKTNTKIKAALDNIKLIMGVFAYKRDSLMYKLNQYVQNNGKEAGAEAIYLYLARIGEISSDHFYLTTAPGESGGTELHGTKIHKNNYDQYMFDYAFNTAGRVDSRSLLAASVDVNGLDHKFMMDLVKNTHMKNLFVKHIFGNEKTWNDKVHPFLGKTEYDPITHTSDYESLYDNFKDAR